MSVAIEVHEIPMFIRCVIYVDAIPIHICLIIQCGCRFRKNPCIFDAIVFIGNGQPFRIYIAGNISLGMITSTHYDFVFVILFRDDIDNTRRRIAAV